MKLKKYFYLSLLILIVGVFSLNFGNKATAGTLIFTTPAVTLSPGGTEYTGILTPGQAGQDYSFQFGATGGTGNYTWYLRPLNGFSLNNEGLLTGAADKAIAGQTYTVRILLSSGGEDISGTFTLRFVSSVPSVPGGPLYIMTSSLPDGTVNQLYGWPSGFQLNASGGTPPYTWSTQPSNPKPGWLTLNPNTGLISGTPQVEGQTTPFTIYVIDNKNNQSSGVFSIKVNPPPGGSSGIPAPGGSIPAPGGSAGGTKNCPVPTEIKNPSFYKAGNETVAYDGLVPCGKCVVVGGSESDGAISGTGKYVSCQFCHFFVMFGGLVNFIIWKVSLPLAVLLLVISGAMFVFAGGQPKMIQQAKSIMTSVVIGLVIIFAAYMVVGAFLSFIGMADWSLQIYKDWNKGFFQLNCPIKI